MNNLEIQPNSSDNTNIVENFHHLCDYGCGQEAHFQLKNGKWCCSKSRNECPSIREKNSKSITSDRICKYCGKLFSNCKGRVFSNHVRWCKSNPKSKQYRDTSKKVANLNSSKMLETKYGKIKEFKVTCSHCGKEFIVQEREKCFPRKSKYFCSKHCSNRFNKLGRIIYFTVICKLCNSEFKSRNPKQLFCCEEHHKEYEKLHNITIEHNQHCKITKTCEICGKQYVGFKKSRVCSLKCSGKLTSKIRKEKREKELAEISDLEKKNGILLAIYKQKCQFDFSIASYPDEFDFSLIEKYGWYKAKNHGNNLNGVSRDHMYSVMKGFKNNIDPSIISHPANCRLILQNENASKKDKCSITLNELMEKIHIWNMKYNSGV